MEVSAQLQGIDRLSHNIVGAMHRLFGFSYSKNTEQFTYQVTMDTTIDFAVGDLLTDSVRISQESDFVCTRVNATARWLASTTDASAVGMRYQNEPTGGAAAAAGAGDDLPFTIAITDGSTDRALQNEPVDAWSAIGNQGGLPGIWSKPRLFARNSNISVQLNMVRLAIAANADSLRMRIAFVGWKIYDAQSLDLTSRRP